MFGDGPIDGRVRCRPRAARAVSGSALRSLSGTSDGGGGEGGTGVSRGRMGGGNVGGVSDGGAVGARERVFFRLGRARARGSPRACVRLCRCLSTAPAARNAMPLKGVGGTHSPSNISSPSKCSSARWAAPPPRSSDMVRSLASPSRLSCPPIGCAHRLARRRRSRSSSLRSGRAKCEATARSDGFQALPARALLCPRQLEKTGVDKNVANQSALGLTLDRAEPFPLRQARSWGTWAP